MYLATSDQIAQLTASLPGALVRTRRTTRISDDDSQVWQSLLSAYAPELKNEKSLNSIARDKTTDGPREIRGPLAKAAPGPWRSLGGFLDYSRWEDRERFLELDRAIAASPSYAEPEEEEFLSSAA